MKVGKGEGGGRGDKCVERTLEPVGHLFNIQHQKDFYSYQKKEILRWRIQLKIFYIFKKYILFEQDEVWSLELFIRERNLNDYPGQQPATK